MSLQLEATHDADRLRWQTEIPSTTTPVGLWRRDGTGSTWEFQCPAAHRLAKLEAGGEPSDSSLALLEEQICAWATAAAAGGVPQDWEPPSVEKLESWLSPDRLDVRAGARLARGEVETSPGSLRLHFAELARLPEDAPDSRAELLKTLCIDVQSLWQFVRFELDQGCVRAEVDLSGVPPSCARALFHQSRGALLLSVQRSIPALRIVADLSARSRILGNPPAGPNSGHA